MSIIHSCRDQILEMANWVLPPVCPVTGEIVPSHGMLSPQAWQGVSFISDPQCGQCGIPFAYQDADSDVLCADCLATPKPYHRAVSALLYNDASRELILKYKHGDKTQAVPVFLPWLLRAGAPILRDVDILMPVPLHPWRLLRRRYNQAALLVAALSKATGVPANYHDLQRSRHTAIQGHLNKKQRTKNVSGAFAVRDGVSFSGQNIILIDDVLTSGATVEACTKQLMKAGANKVSILTLARVTKL